MAHPEQNAIGEDGPGLARSGRIGLLPRLVGMAMMVANCACDPEVTVVREQYLDLIRRLPPEAVTDSTRVVVWTLDGDARAVLFQHPPGKLTMGPFPPRSDCTLRFGLGMAEGVWAESDGVEFRVSLREGTRVTEIFSKPFVPESLPHPGWVDEELPLPLEGNAPFYLDLETTAGPSGKRFFDHAGWANPHLVCRVEEPVVSASRAETPPPIILISIDTLRWDHLGVYGYEPTTSPSLDAFAEEAVVFERCFSPAPFTLPSHATLLTGLAPEDHRAGFDYPEAPLSQGVPTLASRLREAGYRTIALTAGGLVGAKFGLDHGFDDWWELNRANLRSVMPGALDAITAVGNEPFFLFLHTYDVHGPYQQPREFRPSGTMGPEDTRNAHQEELWQRARSATYQEYQKLDRFDGPDEVVASYDAGIRFVDAELGRLFDYLRDRGLYDDAVIIVTSDHGESLFEAGRYFGHSLSMYDREVRVPLLIRTPGGGLVGRRSDLATLADVVPTVLRLAGMRFEPGANTEGLDLFAHGMSPFLDGRIVTGGSSHLGSAYARNERWKLITPVTDVAKEALALRFGPSALPLFEGDRGRAQLYDVREDSDERVNLIDRFADQSRELASRLEAIELPGSRASRGAGLDEETEDQLRALGYLPRD